MSPLLLFFLLLSFLSTRLLDLILYIFYSLSESLLGPFLQDILLFLYSKQYNAVFCPYSMPLDPCSIRSFFSLSPRYVSNFRDCLVLVSLILLTSFSLSIHLKKGAFFSLSAMV